MNNFLLNMGDVPASYVTPPTTNLALKNDDCSGVVLTSSKNTGTKTKIAIVGGVGGWSTFRSKLEFDPQSQLLGNYR